ncbi:DUF4007 family protein [Cetobacterium somerae]|uniref:DUF4007 family protein n=1 Tax=Cetobacterium somerae TaxID=188913 RepID=UPI0038921BEF
MSGAGWNLKEGILIKNNSFSVLKFLEDYLKLKKTMSYKLILFNIILKNIKKEKFEIKFEEIFREFLETYFYIYISNNNKLYDDKKNPIFVLMQNKDIKTYNDLLRIEDKELKFLDKYVLGALYKDTEGCLFGFSKKTKKIECNLLIKNQLTQDIFCKLDNLLKEEFGIFEGKKNQIMEEQVEIDKVKSSKNNYYQQKFALEINYILKSLTENFEGDLNLFDMLKSFSQQEVADNLGIGLPKLVAHLQYMKILNLYDGVSKTSFGEKISQMNNNLDYIEPLLYYFLTKDISLGGHYIYSEVMNEAIYKIFNDNIEYQINFLKILDYSKNISNENIEEKSWNDMVKRALNCLSNSETGFGKMGIIEEIGEEKKTPVYEIHSYWVEPLVGAYIIYDLWKEGQTEMQISSIINDKYHLGRTFLMDEEAIIETLEEIQALGLIDIDLTGGLYQIRKSHRYTKEDILNMMIENS